MKVGEVIRRLHDDGWFLVKSKGGHRQFKACGEIRSRDCLREAESYDPAGDSQEHLSTGRLG
jgi:hypothetical protein